MFGFGRLAASWQLVKASWGVLRSDKQLLIFPIVSTLLTILVTITFIVSKAPLSGRDRPGLLARHAPHA